MVMGPQNGYFWTKLILWEQNLAMKGTWGRQAALFPMGRNWSIWPFFGASNFRGCAWWVQILFGWGRTPSESQWVQSP